MAPAITARLPSASMPRPKKAPGAAPVGASPVPVLGGAGVGVGALTAELKGFPGVPSQVQTVDDGAAPSLAIQPGRPSYMTACERGPCCSAPPSR